MGVGVNMGIWQYDFDVVPRDELSAQAGELPQRFAIGQLEEFTFWKTRQPHEGYPAQFQEWSSEMKSWMPSLRMWGTEELNRIDVLYVDGLVHHIEFRVALHAIDIRFIQLMVDFARASDCVLVSAHSLEVLEPLRANVLAHLVNSNGANEIWDWLHDPSRTHVPQVCPRVFLSHSSADKPFVSRLAVDLRSNNVPVWYDRWELKVGDSLLKRIDEGITESSFLAVVLSANSVKSAWVEKELNAAISRELNEKRVVVLPLVIDNCSIPTFLREKVYADFRTSYDAGLRALLDRILEPGKDHQ
jgi:hypothetical protein